MDDSERHITNLNYFSLKKGIGQTKVWALAWWFELAKQKSW
jgi:hypothetical protein